MLPLRVTEKDAKGTLLFQGNTANVGAGGVYFQTLDSQNIYPGMPVHVVIDISPETFQLLPFGGLRGAGKILRIEEPGNGGDDSSQAHGVAIRMTTRLKFDADLHLPRFDANPQ